MSTGKIRYPLSAAQRLVFEHCQRHPQTTQYNLPAITRLVPAVDVARLVKAWQKLIEQRPVLRTRFALQQNGEPEQWSEAELVIPVVERHMAAAQLEQYLTQGFVRPFDLLSGEPLLRVEFITTEKETVMLTDMQHTIFDGLTFNRLIWGRDLIRLYEGKKISAAECGLYEGALQEQLLCRKEKTVKLKNDEQDAYSRAREYYLTKFHEVHFTTLSKSAEETTGPLVRHREYLPQQLCEDCCHRLGSDAASLFLAAFAHVLSERTGTDEVALCMKHHGRLRRNELKSYGMFVRFLPLRLKAGDNLLAVCRQEIDAATANAIYPLTHFKRDSGRTPRLIYNFLALHGMDTCLHLAGAAMPTVLLDGGLTEDELSCNIYLHGEDYEIRVESSGGMNDAATVQAVAQEIKAAVLELGGGA